jgi:hypothetical protein
MSGDELSKHQNVESLIFTVRGLQAMLDFHLAGLYGTETKRLNEQVKRNERRFPGSFMLQLNVKEWEDLRSQFAASNKSPLLQSQFATAKRRTLPYVFTEQGVAMLSAVLNSDVAVETSIVIMEAFVSMRKFLLQNAAVFQRLEKLEIKQLQTDDKLNQVFKALEAGQPHFEKGIFFDGQIFDAYNFVSDVIKKAKSEIILIDNYIDESVLTMLSKRNKHVVATIYTKTISKTLSLDLEKHNAQYAAITVKHFANSHDRFLMIDSKELYHIGASLKDLGKKWFAFSRMDSLCEQVLVKLKMEAA